MFVLNDVIKVPNLHVNQYKYINIYKINIIIFVSLI